MWCHVKSTTCTNLNLPHTTETSGTTREYACRMNTFLSEYAQSPNMYPFRMCILSVYAFYQNMHRECAYHACFVHIACTFCACFAHALCTLLAYCLHRFFMLIACFLYAGPFMATQGRVWVVQVGGFFTAKHNLAFACFGKQLGSEQ